MITDIVSLVCIFLQHTLPFFRRLSSRSFLVEDARWNGAKSLLSPAAFSFSNRIYPPPDLFFHSTHFTSMRVGILRHPGFPPTFPHSLHFPRLRRWKDFAVIPTLHFFTFFPFSFQGEQSRFFLFAKPKISLSNKSTPPTTTTKYISFSFYLISAVFLCILRRHHLRPSQTIHTLPHTLRIVWAKTGFSIWEGFAEAFLFSFSGQKSRQNPLYSF